MSRRRSPKSISVPIALGSVTVSLAIALLVGWSVLLGQRIASSQTTMAGSVWLLVLGVLSFVVIVTVLVLFSVYLAREILEVRRQTSFIDSVTHELKSPLASLKLFLETLGRAELDPVQREELRTMMLGDVERLSSFIDDVLQASRITHDTLATEADEVGLEQVARAAVSAIAARYRLAEDTIDVAVPRGLTLTTDRAALELVLKNLVDNAIKYSNGAATVSVSAESTPSGQTVIEVRDRGLGIEKKHLRRVFHRFYRVDDESVRRRHGTGLGLFVAAALVRNLGGQIRALSEGCGRGTTIRITLPPAPTSRMRPEGSPAAAEGAA